MKMVFRRFQYYKGLNALLTPYVSKSCDFVPL